MRRIVLLLVLLVTVMGAVAQQPLSLDEALRRAAEGNPFIRAERWGIEAARADSLTGALRPNPLLNNQTLILTDPRYYPVGTNARDAANQQNWWQLTRTFQWPGQRRRRMDFGGAQVRSSEADYALKRQELLNATGHAWLDAWTAQRELAIAEEALANIDSLLRVNAVRERLGGITAVELERTRLLQAQYALRAEVARQQVQRAAQELGILTGNPVGLSVDTAIAFRIAAEVKADSLQLLAAALRPDIRLVQAEIDRATADEAMQQALRWPAPELGGIYNPQNTIPYWGFFGTLELPLFTRNQGEVRRAQAELSRAKELEAATRQRMQAEVARAAALYQAATRNAEAYTDAVRRADAVLATLRYAYRTGGTTIVDLLEAQRAWLETRQEAIAAQEMRGRAYIDLLTVTGLITQPLP